MATDRTTPAIVVGVMPGQADAVARTAARLAELMGGRLEFVQVDLDRYPVLGGFDSGDFLIERAMPIDPDADGAPPPSFDAGLEERLRSLLPETVWWTTHRVAGDPAEALAAFAERIGAELIVVGTREATMRASVREFFTGSVAVHLTHRQHRPVVVVPLSPVKGQEELPWN